MNDKTVNHEQALLSQILTDNDVYYKANPAPWWFLDYKNRRVFNAITECLTDGTTADIVSVGTKGDAGYVAGLSNVVPATGNWKYFADLCKRHGAVEELRKLSTIITDETKTGDPDKIIQSIDEVVEKVVSGTDDFKIQKIGELLKPVIQQLEERYNSRGELPGIATGFPLIDDIIGGLQPERLYVLGARPSQGKSGMMLNMASIIGRTQPVGIMSLESSWREILIREISNLSHINSQRLISGFFAADDFGRLTDAAGEIFEKQIYIYDKPNCTLVEVVGQCRRMVQRHGVKCIFIDYLQLIQVPGTDDRERIVKASNRLKDLTRELHVPIVALAQLRRDVDERPPRLGDFQHSSQIEQDADVAILLYHRVEDENGNKLKQSRPERPGEKVRIFALIEKNRDGRTGRVELKFDPERVRFTEVER